METAKRKRTCENCAEAKVRCSSTTPCDRCVIKKLECVYLVEKKRGRRKQEHIISETVDSKYEAQLSFIPTASSPTNVVDNSVNNLTMIATTTSTSAKETIPRPLKQSFSYSPSNNNSLLLGSGLRSPRPFITGSDATAATVHSRSSIPTLLTNYVPTSEQCANVVNTFQRFCVNPECVFFNCDRSRHQVFDNFMKANNNMLFLFNDTNTRRDTSDGKVSSIAPTKILLHNQATSFTPLDDKLEYYISPSGNFFYETSLVKGANSIINDEILRFATDYGVPYLRLVASSQKPERDIFINSTFTNYLGYSLSDIQDILYFFNGGMLPVFGEVFACILDPALDLFDFLHTISVSLEQKSIRDECQSKKSLAEYKCSFNANFRHRFLTENPIYCLCSLVFRWIHSGSYHLYQLYLQISPVNMTNTSASSTRSSELLFNEHSLMGLDSNALFETGLLTSSSSTSTSTSTSLSDNEPGTVQHQQQQQQQQQLPPGLFVSSDISPSVSSSDDLMESFFAVEDSLAQFNLTHQSTDP